MRFKSDREKYQALRGVARELAGVHAPNKLLRTIVELACYMLQAERGFALLREGAAAEGAVEGPVRVETTGGFHRESTHAMLAISGSVLRHVLDKGEPVLTVDAKSDPRFGSSESVVLHGIRSVACAPMKVRDRVVGALYLDWRGAEASVDRDALDFLEALATHGAIALDGARLVERLEAENQTLRGPSGVGASLIGESPQMQRVFRLMETALPTHAPVLILGESGTGKELVARSLHTQGPRAKGPFIVQFCGALSETLLESELFGHKKGAFTGAIADRKGLFEMAHGGTFFLDEVADISPATQTKLLRVIEEGEFRPVGDTRQVKVDVRIVAATNKNIEEELTAGRFRQDLFYRLNVFTITLPPLRERCSDILLVAESYVRRFCEEIGVPVRELAPEARETLMSYSWPGNVRQLRNVMQRAVLVSDGEWITPEHIELGAPATAVPGQTPGDETSLEEAIRRIALARLERTQGNRTLAARSLGVSLRWLQYKLKEWNG
ncbi:MAG: sigma-54-dependent Fis family transcriptional regulator [Candidatus Eisenbacteria bacterium]|jgi:Nif-specific regulatory protein|nr:sigma-54-dependent Fis family transcriptional regulator [Candidatus Eisenbacteria bacterium]